MKIWCLFAVDNDYNQPENNLVAWWSDKPRPEILQQHCAKYLGWSPDEKQLRRIGVRLRRGEVVSVRRGAPSYAGADFRLRQVEEGKEPAE